MKILVIPHAPAAKVRTRAYEFAKSLAKSGHDVYLFKYNVNENLGLLKKLIWHIKELSPWVRDSKLNNDIFTTISLPTLHYGPAILKNLIYSVWSKLIYRKSYDLVFNASYEAFSIVSKPGQTLIYDFVDDHADGYKRSGRESESIKIDKFIRNEMNKSDFVICSSYVLESICIDRYDKKALLAPNGADIITIKNAIQKSNKQIIIGYVGGLDSWVNFKPVINAIKKVRAEGNPIELHIVGTGDALKNLELPSWVKFLGFRMPDEIPNILSTFDIGILPFEVTPFTDAALPLKIIEYGASQSIAIASPIKELVLRKLPWVLIAELDEDSWYRAIKKGLELNWQSEWSEVVNQFDWDRTVSIVMDKIKMAQPAGVEPATS